MTSNPNDTTEAAGHHSHEPEGTGEQVGLYRLVKLLGEGGFGHVWLAEQKEPINRRVALKLLKPGMDSAEVLSRFEIERRALAMMDHPNIARVLDAGMTDKGRPYFVMEYVKGIPITEFADREKLGPDDRLRLFVDVCRAVQHAHQKGIIHRDLKPSNILVVKVDGKGEPKIIDFGIAKAMYTPSVERTLHTGFGQMLGTPEYMSPEQAGEMGVEGPDIDTRSDVYSMGVILYQLLTGVLPFDSRTLRKAGYEGIRKLIVEVTPPKPSTRLMEVSAKADHPSVETGSSARDIAVKRGTSELRHLTKMVRGDIDWIVMKCLEKERGRRYESASALAQDIERHLKDEPVSAGPPSATYRAAKFLKRHKLGMGFAAVICGLILGALAGMSVLYSQAETERKVAIEERTNAESQKKVAVEERGKADAQRLKAEEEAAKAAAAVDFVLDMFESIDPALAQGREVQVKELLDAASEKADSLKGQPLVEATIRQMLGKAYQRMAKYEPAKKNLARASEIRRIKLGLDDPATLMSEYERGATELGENHIPEAEGILRKVYADRSRVLGAGHADTLQTLSMIAEIEKSREDYAAAEKTLRKVIEGQTAVQGAGHRDTIDSRCSLADVLDQQGRFADAEKEIAATVADAKKSLGENEPMTLQAMSIQGSILAAMDRASEAAEILKDVVARKIKVFGADHPGTLTSMNALAMSLDALGQNVEAEKMYRPLVAGAESRLGPEHSTTLVYKNNLAQCLKRQKKFGEAAPIYREVLAVQRRTVGDLARGTLTTLNNYGLLMVLDGKPAEGLPLLQECLKGLTATLPADHWMLGASKTYVAQCLIDLGRVDEAEVLLLQAYELLKGKMGEGHDRTRQAAEQMVRVWEKRGDEGKVGEWRGRAGK